MSRRKTDCNGDPFDPPQPYLIGDVFRAKDGSIGIIVEASYFSGYSEENKAHRWSYSAREVEDFPLSKCAWWDGDEFDEVLKGPLHQIAEFVKNGPRKKISG